MNFIKLDHQLPRFKFPFFCVTLTILFDLSVSQSSSLWGRDVKVISWSCYEEYIKLYVWHAVSTQQILALVFIITIIIIICFLGPHPQHMEVPRLGVEWELQVPAYATATEIPDPSCVCDLHHSSWQCQTLIHWARPGFEPATSWFLVGFTSTVPEWEHPKEEIF